MKIRFAIAALIGLFALPVTAQIQPDRNDWDWGWFPGVPTVFTNGQATALSQTAASSRILLPGNTLAPIVFRLKSTATGTNINTGSEGRFTVVFGSSIDGTNPMTNGTWTSTFVTNQVNYKHTNWVPGAVFPYIHVLSVTILSNTASGVRLEYAQPNYR